MTASPRARGTECFALIGGRYLPALVIPEPAFVLTRGRFRRLQREVGKAAAKAKYSKLGAYYTVVMDVGEKSAHVGGTFYVHGSEIRMGGARGKVFDPSPYDVIGRRKRRGGKRKRRAASPPPPPAKSTRKAPPPPPPAKARAGASSRKAPPPPPVKTKAKAPPPPPSKGRRRVPPPPPRK